LTGPATAREELTFHFAFVDAGTVTTVASTEIEPKDLTRAQGVPITGNVPAPQIGTSERPTIA